MVVPQFVEGVTLKPRFMVSAWLSHGAASAIMGFAIAVPVVLGSVAIMCLELFVAFLQAYVFVFLATVFIGAATSPH